jgi:hypothetical protein
MKIRMRTLMLAAFVAAGLCLSGTAALAGGGGGNNNDQGQNEGNGGTPATAKVPDGGTTLAMLGCAVVALGYLRRSQLRI